MQKITLNKLAEILGYSTNTIRTWLGNYRFSQFRLQRDYRYTEDFIQTLIDYLELRGKYKAVDSFKRFVGNFNNPGTL